MAHSFIWEQHGLYRKFTGEITGEEILRSNFKIHEDARFETIDYIINDFSDITSHDIENMHTRVYASTDDIVSDARHSLNIAMIVVSADQIALANNYRQYMQNAKFKCELFETAEQAREWVSN